MKNYSYQLFQLIADLKNLSEAKSFLTDFLADSELKTLANRLSIIKLLDEGKSYVEIKKQLKVSSATIASTVELLERKGIELGLRKIKLDAWATNLIEKIKI